MAVAVKVGATENWTESSPVTITKPAGLAPGDFLLFVQFCDFSAATGTAMTGASGVVQLGTTFTTPSGQFYPVCKLWRRVVDGTEPASWSFGTSSSSSTVIGCVPFSGVDTANPLFSGPTGQTGSAGTQHTAPAVAGGTGHCLVTAHASDRFDTNRGNSYTPPTGMDEQVDISAQFTYMAISTLLNPPTSGVARTATASPSSQDPYRGISFVLRAAAAATAPSRLFLPF